MPGPRPLHYRPLTFHPVGEGFTPSRSVRAAANLRGASGTPPPTKPRFNIFFKIYTIRPL